MAIETETDPRFHATVLAKRSPAPPEFHAPLPAEKDRTPRRNEKYHVSAIPQLWCDRATGIAIQVRNGTASRRKRRLNTAPQSGDNPRIMRVFATVVWRVARTKNTMPMPRTREATRPRRPIAVNAATMVRPRMTSCAEDRATAIRTPLQNSSVQWSTEIRRISRPSGLITTTPARARRIPLRCWAARGTGGPAQRGTLRGLHFCVPQRAQLFAASSSRNILRTFWVSPVSV